MLEKEYNKKPNGTKWSPALIAIVGAIIGSGGGIALVFNTPIGSSITRPDPFTGTQASSLIANVERLEAEIDGHIFKHPDISNQYDRRIAVLESQYHTLLLNQQRILDKLDGR